MYSINGIDLTGSQYRELKSLVGLHSDEERASFAAKTLHPYENQNIWNPNGIECYKALESLGLIEGTRGMNAFLFYGVVTQAGIDFVQDFAAKRKEQKQKLWSDRRFQIGLSLLTLVLSTVAGWLAGHFC